MKMSGLGCRTLQFPEMQSINNSKVLKHLRREGGMYIKVIKWMKLNSGDILLLSRKKLGKSSACGQSMLRRCTDNVADLGIVPICADTIRGSGPEPASSIGGYCGNGNLLS